MSIWSFIVGLFMNGEKTGPCRGAWFSSDDGHDWRIVARENQWYIHQKQKARLLGLAFAHIRSCHSSARMGSAVVHFHVFACRRYRFAVLSRGRMVGNLVDSVDVQKVDGLTGEFVSAVREELHLAIIDP